MVMLPHDKEAEQAVLGSIIHDNSQFPSAEGKLKPGNFFSPGHGKIFQAMQLLFAQEKPIDEVTICHQLTAERKLDQVGGMAYVAELVDLTPVSNNLAFYADIVRETANRRSLIVAAMDLTSGDMSQGQAQDFYEQAEKIRDSRAVDLGVSLKDALDSAFEWIEKQYEHDETVIPVRTHTPFDEMTGGLLQGYPHIIGARMGHAKSQFLQHIAISNAVNGVPGLVVSLEMKIREWSLRILSERGEVTNRKLLRGRAAELTDGEWDRLSEAGGEMGSLPLYFTADGSWLGLDEIGSLANWYVLNRGVRFILIDHLTLIKVDGRTGEERQSKRINYLSQLAKRLDIPIVIAVHINRDGEEMPMIKDLVWSDAIGQNAYTIFLLKVPPDEPDKERDRIEVNLAKNRNGRTGMLTLNWTPEYCRVGPGIFPPGGATYQQTSFKA